MHKHSPMLRSSPALLDCPSFSSPSKKRSLLRREPNVADDNDDSRELLLAACKERECQHRHNSYTTTTTQSTLSIFSSNPSNRDPSFLEGTRNQNANHHLHHHQPDSLMDAEPKPVKQNQSVLMEYPPPSQSYQQSSQQSSQQAQPQPQPGQPQSLSSSMQSPPDAMSQPAGQLLSKPRELVAIRQCSAPTPLYPAYTTVPPIGPIQQQHSFPEWSPPYRVLPSYICSGSRSPPLSAAAASSSLPPSLSSCSDDLCHPAAASLGVVLGQGQHFEGSTQLATPLAAGQPQGWMAHGQAKGAACLTTATTTADADTHGHTPDSPMSRSGDDDGVAERCVAGDLRDSVLTTANHVSPCRPPPPPPLLPRHLPGPLHPYPSTNRAHTSDAQNTCPNGEGQRSGLHGGGDFSTSAESTSVTECSLHSLSPPQPALFSPTSQPLVPLVQGPAHNEPSEGQVPTVTCGSGYHLDEHPTDQTPGESLHCTMASATSSSADTAHPAHVHAAEEECGEAEGGEVGVTPGSAGSVLYSDASG